MTSPESITDSSNNSHQTLPLYMRNSSKIHQKFIRNSSAVETGPHTTSEPSIQASGDVAQHIASMASDRANGNGLTAVGSQVPTVPPLESIEGAVVEAQSSSSDSGDAPQERRPHTTSVSSSVETDPHTTSEPLVQASRDVAHHIASMASDRAHCNGLTTVGSQVPTVPSLEGIEGAVVEAQTSSSGDAPEERRPPRIPIDPKLYDAVVKGSVGVLDDFLQSQDLLLLDGVTIGDNTVLHIAASSNRDLTWQRTADNVDFAREVYLRNGSLLTACNRLKETPLHCAAKVSNYRMVSRLISFAEEEDQAVKQTFLTARNIHGETALHEAVRVGHGNIVEKLILSEPSITGIVDADGVSPLYLATMMNAVHIVEIFTKEPSRVSFAGPKGQTALHIAVLKYPRITCTLLEWNKSLATKVDDLESTPLHYAASAGNLMTVQLLLGDDDIKKAAYMADKNGLFPIHTAAKCGKALIIKELIEKFPDSDELLDTNGRNFLHLAILSGRGNIIVSMGGDNHTFLRMLNARDYRGNTPLHLASGTGQYHIVIILISMKIVYSSIMNRNGLTPFDFALMQVDRGFHFTGDTKFNMLRCMMWTGAIPSPRRVDHIRDDLQIPWSDIKGEREKVESISRNLAIITVLIATVTFAASFTMPGGYIADDHINRGTPILSRKYAFKAFIVADSLAFLSSIFATAWLIYAGSGNVDFDLRQVCLKYSIIMVVIAGKATICAFSLAIYTMIYQVNLGIGILVCVASFCLLPFSNPAYWGYLSLAPPIVKRIGWRGLYKIHDSCWTSMRCTQGGWIWGSFFGLIFLELLYHIFLYGLIFGLALI